MVLADDLILTLSDVRALVLKNRTFNCAQRCPNGTRRNHTIMLIQLFYSYDSSVPGSVLFEWLEMCSPSYTLKQGF